MASGNVAIGGFEHRLTINVRIQRRFYLRMWIAKQLFHLMGWVLQANIKVEMED